MPKKIHDPLDKMSKMQQRTVGASVDIAWGNHGVALQKWEKTLKKDPLHVEGLSYKLYILTDCAFNKKFSSEWEYIRKALHETATFVVENIVPKPLASLDYKSKDFKKESDKVMLYCKAQYALGLLFLEEGKISEAIVCANEGLKMYPKDPDLPYILKRAQKKK